MSVLVGINPQWLFGIDFFLGFVITAIICTPIIQMVSQSSFLRPNFRGDMIPVGVGFVFLVMFLGAICLDYVLLPGLLGEKALLFFSGLAVITFLGLVDDTMGSRNASGLSGHFKALLRGELTTGGLKALGGGILAVTIAAVSEPFWGNITLLIWLKLLSDTLIIALSINSINLLDLRPGRAGKGFLFFALLLLLLTWGNRNLLPLALLMGSVVAYLPWDLKAKAMMGDTGSNALGIAIGMTAVWCLPFAYQMGYLIFLIGFHIFTEKYSLTKVIEGNCILDYLDKLGRN